MNSFSATNGVWIARVAIAGVVIAGGISYANARKPDFDLVIRNGIVIDGSGNPGYRANVGIRDGKIAAIGAGTMSGGKEIDATGKVVAPGFIDVHTHAENVVDLPDAENFVRMGVTSVVIGNCGSSELDLAALFKRLESKTVSVNVASLIGHNAVRRSAMGGNHNRLPTPDELEKMRASVRKAMEDGAVGLSTGLIYLPGTFSKTDEIIELAKIVREFDGIYASHMRNESRKIVEAIEELLTVARGSGCRAELSHIKLGGEVMWGKHTQILDLLDKAREEGVEVTQDQYVYAASSTSISALIDDKFLDGGTQALIPKLKEKATKQAVIDDLKANLKARGREDYAYVVIADHKANRSFNGKNIVEIAQQMYGTSTLDDQLEAILHIFSSGGASCVFHGMSEDDVIGFMKHPNTMFASDSACRDPKEGMPHPRGYGNNARVLGRYVRELKAIRLEEAIRKMTSLPAQTFRLLDRGLIRVGMAADVVVFDSKAVADPSTYTDPHHLAIGFKAVVVNGALTVEGDKHTKTRNGRPLRHQMTTGTMASASAASTAQR